MAVTWALTVNKTQIVGSQVVKDVTLVATGTYVTGGDTTLTANSFGLDYIDIIIPVVDGHGANTNGVVLLAPNLGAAGGTGLNGTVTMQMFATGSGNAAAFAELGNGNTITGFTAHCLVYGVA